MLRQKVHKRRSPSLATQSTHPTLFSNLPRNTTPTRSLPAYTHYGPRHDHLEHPPGPRLPDPATDQDLPPSPQTVPQPPHPPAQSPQPTSTTSHTGFITSVGVIPLPGPTEGSSPKPSGPALNDAFRSSDSSSRFVSVKKPGTVPNSAAWTPYTTKMSGKTSRMSQNEFLHVTTRVEESTSPLATVTSSSSTSQGTLVSSTSSPSTQSPSNHVPIILCVALGSLAGVVFAFVLFIVLRRRRRKKMSVVEVEEDERGHISVVFVRPQDRRNPEPEGTTSRNLVQEDESGGVDKSQSPLDIPPVIPPIPTLSDGRLSIFESARSDSPTDVPNSPRPRHKRSINQRVAEFLRPRSSHEQASRPEMKWQGRPLPPVPSIPPPSPNARVGRYVPSALSQYTLPVASPSL